jgi:type II secretory pathway component PulF
MMGRYRYRAATAEGHVVEGVIQAESRRGALEELGRQRLYPVDLAPDAGRGRAIGHGRLGRGPAVALFARTVATMLGAGVPLDRAVGFSAEQVRNPAVMNAARLVHEQLHAGETLAAALQRHPSIFSPVFVAMVAAGEESGSLDESLADLAEHLDELVELRAQIRSSLLYPALMAVASGVGVVILLLFVVPRFASLITAEGGSLPLSTRLLLGISQLVVHGGWLFLLAVAGLAWFTRGWLARPENRRRFHAWRLGWPLAGDLELKYVTARFARAFGMLLRGGRPVLPALEAARNVASNAAVRASLDQAAGSVSHGNRVHQALSGTLPPLAAELIAVGEESGRLDEMCLRVAVAYDTEVRRSLRALVTIIEPALILFFALIVGFVALAMLQAIYGINPGMLS